MTELTESAPQGLAECATARVEGTRAEVTVSAEDTGDAIAEVIQQLPIVEIDILDYAAARANPSLDFRGFDALESEDKLYLRPRPNAPELPPEGFGIDGVFRIRAITYAELLSCNIENLSMYLPHGEDVTTIPYRNVPSISLDRLRDIHESVWEYRQEKRHEGYDPNDEEVELPEFAADALDHVLDAMDECLRAQKEASFPEWEAAIQRELQTFEGSGEWWFAHDQLMAYHREMRLLVIDCGTPGDIEGARLAVPGSLLLHEAYERIWAAAQRATAPKLDDASSRTGFRLRRAGQIKPKPIDWLVKGFLPRNTLATLVGASFTGKSLVALGLSASIGCGVPWGDITAASGMVAYIAGEGIDGIERRLAAWSVHNGVSLENTNLFVSECGAMLDQESQLHAVVSEIDRIIATLPCRPALVVVDTLARNFCGDENSTQDMTRFINALDVVRNRYACAVIVVHHTGLALEAQKRARGSSALYAAADAEFMMFRRDDVCVLKCTKAKDWRTPDDLAFAIEEIELPAEWSDQETGDVTSSAVAVATTRSVDAAGAGITDNQRAVMETVARLADESGHASFKDVSSDLMASGAIVDRKVRWKVINSLTRSSKLLRIGEFLADPGVRRGGMGTVNVASNVAWRQRVTATSDIEALNVALSPCPIGQGQATCPATKKERKQHTRYRHGLPETHKEHEMENADTEGHIKLELRGGSVARHARFLTKDVKSALRTLSIKVNRRCGDSWYFDDIERTKREIKMLVNCAADNILNDIYALEHIVGIYESNVAKSRKTLRRMQHMNIIGNLGPQKLLSAPLTSLLEASA